MTKRLTQDQHSGLMRSQRALLKATEWAAEVQTVFAQYFADPRTKANLAVSFEPVKAGLGARFSTPFGEGRVVSVPSLLDDRVQIRYIFEKAFTFEDGRIGYANFAEIRIDAEGVVTATDGERLAAMNSLYESETSQAVVEIAMSVIYALGSNTQYFVATE